MKTFLARCSAFAALLMATLQLVELALPFYWGNDGFAAKMKYLEESDTRYDTIFMGSSRIYRQIDPAIFDRVTGGRTRAFNLGSPATFNPEAYYLYERLLDDDIFADVKFVLIELQSVRRIAPDNIGTRRVIYAVNLENYLFATSSLAETEARPAVLSRARARYRTSFWQHVFKLHVLGKMMAFPLEHPILGERNLGPNRDGFKPLDVELEEERDASGALRERRASLVESPHLIEDQRLAAIEVYEHPETWIFSETHLRRIERMIERSKARGIEIRFVVPPRRTSSMLREVMGIYARLGEGLAIDVGDPRAYPEFYELEISFDSAHLNSRGAELLTRLLAEKLIESLKN